jgi:hypothetical protein
VSKQLVRPTGTIGAPVTQMNHEVLGPCRWQLGRKLKSRPCLDHEVGDDAVELDAVIVPPPRQLEEVLARLYPGPAHSLSHFIEIHLDVIGQPRGVANSRLSGGANRQQCTGVSRAAASPEWDPEDNAAGKSR